MDTPQQCSQITEENMSGVQLTTYADSVALPHNMRSRVYETVRCPSVCLSQHGPSAANPLLQVSYCGSGRQVIRSIAAAAAGKCGQCHVVSVRRQLISVLWVAFNVSLLRQGADSCKIRPGEARDARCRAYLTSFCHSISIYTSIYCHLIHDLLFLPISTIESGVS